MKLKKKKHSNYATLAKKKEKNNTRHSKFDTINIHTLSIKNLAQIVSFFSTIIRILP